MTEQPKQRTKTPGPVWAWVLAAIVFAQLVKRGIIGWPLPKDFDFGSRFLENLVANLLYGLPVFLILIVITVLMNREGRQNTGSSGESVGG